jgi:hypothetical protein
MLLIHCLQVVLICGFCSLVGWVAVYTKLAPWWRNPVGQTLVIKTALIALMFIPSILSLFFHLSAATSKLMGWVDVALIGAVTPVMLWRIAVWMQLHKAGGLPRDGGEQAPVAEPAKAEEI